MKKAQSKVLKKSKKVPEFFFAGFPYIGFRRIVTADGKVGIGWAMVLVDDDPDKLVLDASVIFAVWHRVQDKWYPKNNAPESARGYLGKQFVEFHDCLEDTLVQLIDVELKEFEEPLGPPRELLRSKRGKAKGR